MLASLLSSLDDHHSSLISSTLALLWLIWVVSSPIPTPCEVKEDVKNVADAVFLGHPSELSDFVSIPAFDSDFVLAITSN